MQTPGLDARALDATVERFATLLARSGLRAALGFLNERTRYRFTGVYRFDPPMLRNVALFDRENPSVNVGGDLPMLGSPCSIVQRLGGAFTSDDTSADPQLRDVSPPTSVVAYCGVPLFGDDRSCFGSLCHYDLRPRLAATGEIPLLERAAPLVMATLASVGASSVSAEDRTPG